MPRSWPTHHLPTFPPPVVSQQYQDVIHTLFILGADDIHTVRGVWRVGVHVVTLRHEWLH